MTNEESERAMNFIERQERFAEEFQRQQAVNAQQQALNAHMQQVMLSVIEAQERNSVDIVNLLSVVTRIVEAMPRGGNGNGGTA